MSAIDDRLQIEGYHPPKQSRGREAAENIKHALIALLASGKRYPDITNLDIAEAADAHVQSFYHWFEKGKDTVTSVLAAEYSMGLLEGFMTFFAALENETKTIEPLVHDLNEMIKSYLRAHPGAVPILFSPDIPASLRTIEEPARNAALLRGAEFLGKRGIGQRRFLVAQTINIMFVAMRQLSARLDRNGKVVFDPDVEEELERLLVRYLKPYFEQ